MPNSRQPTQNDGNSIFVEFLTHTVLFSFCVLAFFCLYIIVSDFLVGGYFYCVCVFFFIFFVCFLDKRKKEMAGS